MNAFTIHHAGRGKFRCVMMENCHTVTFTAYESGVGIIKDYITFVSRAKTKSGLIRAAEKSVTNRFVGISPKSLRLITVDGNLV